MKLYYDAAYGLLFICAGLVIGYFDAYSLREQFLMSCSFVVPLGIYFEKSITLLSPHGYKEQEEFKS